MSAVRRKLRKKPSSSFYISAFGSSDGTQQSETMPLVLFNQADKETVSQKQSRVDAQKKLLKLKQWYPLGLDETKRVAIDKLIRSPRASFISRIFDAKHALRIQKSMVEYPSTVPNPADVLPWDTVNNKPYPWKTWDDLKKSDTVRYVVIDGQHSVVAAKALIEKMDKIGAKEYREHFMYRRCQILSAATPQLALTTISANLNSIARVLQYNS